MHILQILEVDKENLQSNLQLLNIRFSSLNEILKTQEAEISKVDLKSKDKTLILLFSIKAEKQSKVGKLKLVHQYGSVYSLHVFIIILNITDIS